MSLRTTRERVLQTCLFELGGIALVTPLYMALFGASAKEGYVLIIAISIAVTIWAPLYGMAFDCVEQRLTGRLASDRPHRVRALHAVLYEVTSVSVTLPLVIAISGHTMFEALALNIQLTLFYVGYAYLFFLGYDKLRPVAVIPNGNVLIA